MDYNPTPLVMIAGAMATISAVALVFVVAVIVATSVPLIIATLVAPVVHLPLVLATLIALVVPAAVALIVLAASVASIALAIPRVPPTLVAALVPTSRLVRTGPLVLRSRLIALAVALRARACGRSGSEDQASHYDY